MSVQDTATPYWRLSGFYLFYFASLGAFVPYLGPYLKSLDITPFEIGVIVAITMATKIISPNVWGWIADHTGQRMRIVQIGCLLAALSFLIIFAGQTFGIIVLVMTLFSFFWNAALPQFEATTFNHLGDKKEFYASIRLWGSIGFIISVVALGYVFNTEPYAYLPYVVSSLLVAIWLMSLSVPESAAGHLTLDHEPIRNVLRKPHVMGLLMVCFCMQASHGPYYAFYNLYMARFGYSTDLIGWFWGIGVAVEVVVFLIMHRLFRRFSLRNLLMWSLALAVLRWSLIAAYPDILPVAMIAQIFHAATFGLFHATAIRLIHEHFRGAHQGRGQALYSSVSYGAGGALGSFYGGVAWDYLGLPWVFTGSAAIAVLGLWFAWRYVHPENSDNRLALQ